MYISCNFVVNDIVSDRGAVSIRVVEDDTSVTVTKTLKHVRKDGESMKSTTQTSGPSTSGNTVRMCERRKYPAYREHENERRRQRRKELKKKDTRRYEKILPRSILSENSDNIARATGASIQDYVVHKKVEIIQVITFIHPKLEKTDKENEKTVIVYRSKSGAIRPA